MRSSSVPVELVVGVRLATQAVGKISARIKTNERKLRIILRLMVHLQLVFRLL